MSATARMKHFGWGREGEGLSAEEEAFVLARAEARFGTVLKESASAPELDEIKLDAPRVTAPASLPFCTSEHYDRAAHTYGKSYPGARARHRARLRERARRRRLPAQRSGSRRRARLGGRRRRDRHAVRRRVERVRRRRAEALQPQGRRHDRPARDGQGEGGRQNLARRADRRRHLRARARSAAQAARPHAAPFPAELRILDARRLDRDARRRPFRDALHPHRRFRGSRCAPSRRKARWKAAACPAPARARARTA